MANKANLILLVCPVNQIFVKKVNGLILEKESDEKVKLKINEEMKFKGNENVLECICLGRLMAYTENYETARKLSRVTNASKPAVYTFRTSHVEHNGSGRKRRMAWHFIIPTQRTKTAIRVLTNNGKNEKSQF